MTPPAPDTGATLLWAPQAWVGGRWQQRVVLDIDSQGQWQAVTPDLPCPPHATVLPGPVLPPLVNAHSHAFQRAFAGMAERRDSQRDDFWSWRDRMYGVALRITPAQLRAVAAHLYAELLQGGYTQVCEFHYLHHAPDGSAYPDPAAMTQALADAAADAGIGLTMLPVLYERAGFSAPQLRADQRRFATDVASVLALQQAVQDWQLPLVNAGVAVHSLRAAQADSILALAAHSSGPVHIHVAEQTAEVDDCLAATGCRPIEWLARHAPLDARWQLVHATHALPQEIDAVAASGAGVVLCPGTEANLGDGLPDLPHWLAAGVPLSVGSDSHVTRTWPEELRWLDWGQRLHLRQRNVAAAPGSEPATAARLFQRMLAGGGAAAGFAHWGLQAGARADLLVVDTEEDALQGLPASHVLDGLVFAAPRRPFSAVMVAGRWQTLPRPDLAGQHARAMRTLWPAQAAATLG
jgi:formimidoylglutamate deiminase